MTSIVVTTQSRLSDYAGETGIPMDQLELVAAKSALIRHLASKPETRELFIVKGGTLLYHAYQGPRVSFKDVDFARPNPRRIGGASDDPASSDDEDIARLRSLEHEVLEHMTIDTPEFELQTDQGRLNLDHAEMVEVTNIPFTITGLRRRSGVKLTVSIRQSERIGPKITVPYTDELLDTQQTFDVSGLCIEELAAEKMIGWGLRGLTKHYVDLAIIGHRYGATLSRTEVTGILHEKITRERAHRELRKSYDYACVRSAGDLVRKFEDPAHAKSLHARSYESQMGVDVVLDDTDARRIDGLDEVAKVKQLVSLHWGALFSELALDK